MYSTDLEEMSKNANVVKDTLLGALEREGLLTKTAQEIAGNYAVVLHKRGWLGSMWEKLFGDTKDPSFFKVSIVKLV